MHLITSTEDLYASDRYYVCRRNNISKQLEFWNRRRKMWQTTPNGCAFLYQLTAAEELSNAGQQNTFIANNGGNKVTIGRDRYNRQISNPELIA